MVGFSDFRTNTNLLLVIDHARAGNMFFSTIFDQHSEVLCCPWLHYLYSYIQDRFAEKIELDSKEALSYLRTTPYFSLLYDEETEIANASIRRIGGNPDVDLNRKLFRESLAGIVLKNPTVSRKDLILAIYFSYAIGMGRNIQDITYILCPDCVSLRSESAMTGFSGVIIDNAFNDFPKAKAVHLVRDPRANLASLNHEFVNSLGNMYGLHLGNFWNRVNCLLRNDFDHHRNTPFVFGYWLIYVRQTFETISLKKETYSENFVTVKNEDLNLNFTLTMKALCKNLGVDWDGNWDENFEPTMLNRLWTGTGAYNNQYQKNVNGLLKNDQDSVSQQITGPNEYVTKRWRSRLSPNEVFIIEGLLFSEMQEFGYECISYRADRYGIDHVLRRLWKPLRGEIPSIRWTIEGLKLGVKELCNRVFLLLAFPPIYLLSRISFLKVAGKYFDAE